MWPGQRARCGPFRAPTATGLTIRAGQSNCNRLPRCTAMPLLALPFPGHRPRRDRHRSLRDPLVCARLRGRASRRLVLRQAARRPEPSSGRRCAQPTPGGYRRPDRLGGARASCSAGASATSCSTISTPISRSRLEILAVWHGGMSFHGGFLGAVAGDRRSSPAPRGLNAARACSTSRRSSTPIGLFFGRIANFINGELWGRVRRRTSPTRSSFPHAGPVPRHPSQLYEAFGEGLVLFVVMAFAVRRFGFRRPGPARRHVRPRLRGRAHRLRVLPRARSRSSASCSDPPSRRSAAASPWACCSRSRWRSSGHRRSRSPRAARRARGRSRRPAGVTPFERSLRELIALEGPITVERYMALCVRALLRDPRPARGGRRFHDGAGDQPDVRRAPRPLGRRRLAADGRPGRLPPRRARPRPRHPHGRRAAGGAARAGLPRRRRGPPRRDEPRPARAAARRPSRRPAAPAAWHDALGRGAGRAGDRDRQRVLRRPADPPVRRDRARLVRAPRRDRGRPPASSGFRAEPDAPLGPAARPGDVREWPGAAVAVAQDLARRLARDGGAALLIDYGYWGPAAGDTLQAVRRNAFADPLAEPGEADLTAHVDFAAPRRGRRGGGRPAARPGRAGGFPDGARHCRPARRRSSGGRRAAQAEAIDRAAERLTARGATAMGEPVQGPGPQPSRPCDPPGPAGPARDPRGALTPVFIEAPELASYPNLRHAFFTRQGGVSEGIYASLNGGLGSSDDPARVAREPAPDGGRARRRARRRWSACIRSIRPTR